MKYIIVMIITALFILSISRIIYLPNNIGDHTENKNLAGYCVTWSAGDSVYQCISYEKPQTSPSKEDVWFYNDSHGEHKFTYIRGPYFVEAIIKKK